MDAENLRGSGQTQPLGLDRPDRRDTKCDELYLFFRVSVAVRALVLFVEVGDNVTQ